VIVQIPCLNEIAGVSDVRWLVDDGSTDVVKHDGHTSRRGLAHALIPTLVRPIVEGRADIGDRQVISTSRG
jgi:hypothetical protein